MEDDLCVVGNIAGRHREEHPLATTASGFDGIFDDPGAIFDAGFAFALTLWLVWWPSQQVSNSRKAPMQPIHIALTTATNAVLAMELSEVASALQKQVTRDFAPIWNVSATVDAFAIDQIPAGYWPIIVQDTLDDPNAAGYHQTEDDNTPYSLVLYGDTWSLTASHECLEMLADPFGSKKSTGQSLRPEQGRVDYLVEVCDPCEDAGFAYAVNGVMVSDFYTPNFFDPVSSAQVRYSFTGAITRPFQVLANGYLSWFSDGLMFQAMGGAGGGIEFTDGVPLSDRKGRPLREFVDSLSPEHQARLSNSSRSAVIRLASDSARDARTTHSARILGDIERRFGRK